MDSQYTIQQELRDLNSQLPIKKDMPFAVPGHYFEELAGHIMAKIKGLEGTAPEEITSLSPLLASLSRKMPFSVPTGYFEQPDTNLTDLVKEEILPPVLASAGKQMPYSVPNDYFNTFPTLLLNKVKKPTARVVSFNQKWMRYAVAAIIIGVLAIGGISYFNNSPAVDLAHQPHEWVAKKLSNVSTQALDDFIKTTEPLNTQSQIAKSTGTTKEVRKLLQNVSTSELDEFLRSVPHENDELSATN